MKKYFILFTVLLAIFFGVCLIVLSKQKSVRTNQDRLLSYCYEEVSDYSGKEWNNLSKEWDSNKITYGEFEQRSSNISNTVEQMREDCLKNYSNGYKSFLIQQEERSKKTKSDLIK